MINSFKNRVFKNKILILFCLLNTCLIILTTLSGLNTAQAQLLNLQKEQKASVFQTGINTDNLKNAAQAFKPIATVIDAQTILLEWLIDSDYYIYKNKVKISIEGQPLLIIDKIIAPKGVDYADEFFGKQEIYDSNVSYKIQLKGEWQGDEAKLNIRAQGCAKDGLCFAPEDWALPIILQNSDIILNTNTNTNTSINTNANTDVNADININKSVDSATALPKTPESEPFKIANLLKNKRYIALPLFFLFGLLLSLTPCVLPMLPIISSIIAGEAHITAKKGFFLALLYVVTTALIYSVMGMLAGYMGANISAFFQHPFIIIGFAVLFVIFSLAMFDVFQLQMPVCIQNKLNKISTKAKHNRMLSVIIMGILSALIIGPCVAPPLAAVLAMIAETGDIVLGGVSLFVMGLGMGVPILLLGASCGHILPKAGAWMLVIKQFFGYLLLFLALYFLERIIPNIYYQALLGILLIRIVVWIYYIDGLSNVAKQLKQTIAILILLFALHQIWQVLNVISPMHNQAYLSNNVSSSENNQSIKFSPIKGIKELEQALANQNTQWTILEFSADWCVDCKRMEKYTFTDKNVQQVLGSFNTLQADITQNDSIDRALAKKFNLFGPPAILFFDKAGIEVPHLRITGFANAADFYKHLQSIIE
ncbi:thiol:disulfide interchange protein and activator of DsbC [Gammaproteobacteria bacterium]|nr:thiol:disulfide interchange protein and activator of DsbC [Gammaproteobacteria bacterium]